MLAIAFSGLVCEFRVSIRSIHYIDTSGRQAYETETDARRLRQAEFRNFAA